MSYSVIFVSDSNMTSAVNTVLAYFSDNIGLVISALVGVVFMAWLLGFLLRSIGVKRPGKSGGNDEDFPNKGNGPGYYYRY